jgi:4'-phosphopantetheinyl transferase
MDTKIKLEIFDLASPDPDILFWNQPLKEIRLDSGCVHIWKVGIDHTLPRKELRQFLSTDEQIRAGRIIIPEKRYSFISSRYALRKILSFYTGQSVVSIKFNYGINGKPYLLHSGKESSISFNISHSENLLVVALINHGQIGIDLEYFHQIGSINWVINNYFSLNDQVFFSNLPERQKAPAFFSAWTKKEARGKAIGTGLSSKIKHDYLDQSSLITLPADRYLLFQEKDWYLRFSPQNNYTAAAVIQSIKKPKMSFFNFSSWCE